MQTDLFDGGRCFRRAMHVGCDVRSTALVSDEFVVNAGVLVAYYTKNMLEEYVHRGLNATRRRYATYLFDGGR